MKIIKNSVNPCESVSEKLLCALGVLCGFIFSNFSVALDLPLYNCRESSTNQPFYAKQTQSCTPWRISSPCLAKCYAKSTFLSKAKNKPNSNPIKANQTQFLPEQTQNKPNSNPNLYRLGNLGKFAVHRLVRRSLGEGGTRDTVRISRYQESSIK